MLQTIPIRSEDDPFLFQVYASTRAAEMSSWGWDDEVQHTFLTMQFAAQQHSYALQHPGAEHCIIIFQNIRTGRIIVSRTDQEINLVDISLLPEFCNQGIGTKLLKKLQEESAVTGKPLRLSVLKTNPAQRLYIRLGFTITGDNDLYNFMEWRTATLSCRAFQ